MAGSGDTPEPENGTGDSRNKNETETNNFSLMGLLGAHRTAPPPYPPFNSMAPQSSFQSILSSERVQEWSSKAAPWNPLKLTARAHFETMPNHIQDKLLELEWRLQVDSKPVTTEHQVAESVRSTTTFKSSSTYYTALSGTWTTERDQSRRLKKDSEYAQLLQSKDLWPVDPMLESDWSGRGQHAAFLKRETKMLNTILDVQDILGTTSTAIVQSVKCKRILLARKTIRCSERFTKRKAIDEVAHLSKLNHSHVVQVIGTYIAGNELSILMYPVAESNLESFMQTLDPGTQLRHEWEGSVIALSSFFGCLSHAVDYIHLNLTKHMDIKPQNLLVRNIQRSKIDCSLDYKIYIADFGIARSYEKLEFTDTEGPTMFTRKYAAPEVVDRQKRGLSADIFSLGCVFVEICATISNFFPYTPAPAPASMFGQLASYRSTAHQHAKISSNGEYDPLRCLKALLASNEYENTSYSANIYSTCNFVEEMHYAEDLSPLYTSEMAIKVLTRLPLETVANMLRENPLERPSARLVASSFTVGMCCEAGTDMLEAAPEEDFRRYAASVAEDESE